MRDKFAGCKRSPTADACDDYNRLFGLTVTQPGYDCKVPFELRYRRREVDAPFGSGGVLPIQHARAVWLPLESETETAGEPECPLVIHTADKNKGPRLQIPKGRRSCPVYDPILFPVRLQHRGETSERQSVRGVHPAR